MSESFPALNHPQALLDYFRRLFAQVETTDEGGESMASWHPQRLSVSPREDLIAIQSESESGEYQRLDLYDLAAHRLIAMNAKSAYDAQPVFDTEFTAEPGHIRFLFDEYESATSPAPPAAVKPSLLSRLLKGDSTQPPLQPQRKYWACGYSLERRNWILPNSAELDTTQPRAVSAAARALHPWYAQLPTRPVAFGGAWHDFGVYYHLQADAGTGDFFASTSLHGDTCSQVGRIAARTGALAWSAEINDYLGFEPIGEWVVTDGAVLQAVDGSELCRFAETSALQCGHRQVHAAPDASLWIQVDGDEAPGRFWRVDTGSGAVAERQLPYFQLLQHGTFWAGCMHDAEGCIEIHGLQDPGVDGFAPARWSTKIASDVAEKMDLAYQLRLAHSVGSQHVAGISSGQWWSLDLGNGAWAQGTLSDNASACSADSGRLYFTQGTDNAYTVHWLDPVRGTTGDLPLHASEWRSVLVKDGVVHAIENLGTPFVTRHVPVAYALDSGERLWEGAHTRLCNHIVPTQDGIAVGAMEQMYFFAAA